MKPPTPRRLAALTFLVLATVAVAAVAFLLHVNLSTAGSLELFLVLLAALRLGFLEATIVSLAATLCLNFLFTDPVFTFTVADPQNWVSLFTFEATALLVSGLSSKVRLASAQAEEQRSRANTLYELSRAVLLIDQRADTAAQLTALIREILHVQHVEIYIPPDSGPSEAHQTFLLGQESDDPTTSRRLLRLGTTTLGAIVLRGWPVDPLSADAAASIAAIAFERNRASARESRAAVERDAERLRAAVLDGLAHGFKTPLTAIQTASSGLLAIHGLTPTQHDLVSLIDERATTLAHITTRLLQTATLEARELRLRRTPTSLGDLLESLLLTQPEDTRARIALHTPATLREENIDPALIELALQQLLDNAQKYSAIGTPIDVTLDQSSTGTRVIVQNVNMPGSSIRPDERTRIFERFYRGAASAHGPAGTGLGLSIAKKIAEAHGGTLAVESDSNSDDTTTRFLLTLQHHLRDRNG